MEMEKITIKEGTDTVTSMVQTASDTLDLLERDIKLPNLPLTTANAGLFWDTLEESHGLTLQQNSFTRSARIIDRNNRRVAWGTVAGMRVEFQNIIEGKKRLSSIFDYNRS